MAVIIDPEADREFYDAVMWYDDQEAGLGDALHAAVEAGLKQISDDVLAGSVLEGYDCQSRLRRVSVDTFPYSIIYVVGVNSVDAYVLAIAHQSRRPDYWKSRRRRYPPE